MTRCPPLRDRVAIAGSTGTLLTWQAGVGVQSVRLQSGRCSAPNDVELAGRLLDAVGDGDRRYLVGAVLDGAVKVGKFNTDRLEWTQGGAAEAADGYQGIDGLGRCGQSICVLDARKAMLHVLDDNGGHLAATAAPALGATAEVSRLTAAADGSVWLLTRDGMRTGLVRVVVA